MIHPTKMKETTSIPDVIAKRLGNPGPYKLRHVGYTLALEYLRNVGIRAGKPDVHVTRILSEKRLAYYTGDPFSRTGLSPRRAISSECFLQPTYLDNLLWLFCAQDYGDICRKNNPRCRLCALAPSCRYPHYSAKGLIP